MRISDWSSDVCSSDLSRGRIPHSSRKKPKKHHLSCGTWTTFEPPFLCQPSKDRSFRRILAQAAVQLRLRGTSLWEFEFCWEQQTSEAERLEECRGFFHFEMNKTISHRCE